MLNNNLLECNVANDKIILVQYKNGNNEIASANFPYGNVSEDYLSDLLNKGNYISFKMFLYCMSPSAIKDDYLNLAFQASGLNDMRKDFIEKYSSETNKEQDNSYNLNDVDSPKVKDSNELLQDSLFKNIKIYKELENKIVYT